MTKTRLGSVYYLDTAGTVHHAELSWMDDREPLPWYALRARFKQAVIDAYCRAIVRRTGMLKLVDPADSEANDQR